MGDDDVICLSSDDEVAHDESPRKKAKINYAPLTAKIEPKEKGKSTILCYRKRKSDDGTEISISNVTKKQKVEKNIVEEITIESPIKNELIRPSTTINELSVEVLRDKVENGTISINKVTVKKPTEFSKSANQPKSGHSKVSIAPVRKYVQKPLMFSNSRESNGNNTTSSKLRISKNISEKAASIVVNPVAKLKDEAISKSPLTILRIEHPLFDGTKDTDATGAKETADLAKSKIEIPDGPLPGLKSEDERLTSSPKSGNVVGAAPNPKAAADKTDEPRDKELTPEKSETRAASDSPEVLILPSVETPKASRVATDKTAVKALFLKTTDNASISDGKTSPNTENFTNDPVQSTSTSQLSCLTNCQNLNDDQDNISSKTTDSVTSIKTQDSPSVSPSEREDTTKSSSKSQASGSKIWTKSDAPVIRRIIPQKVAETMSKSNQSNSDTEKTSKSVENPESHNSEESVSNIANGHEKSMLNDKKHSKTKKESSSDKNSVRKTGGSKTPDGKKSPLSKRKSASPEIVEKAKNKNEDASKIEEFEPQPGCSKSPDEITDGKPCLVVFDKKPVALETEDTFSMFLSLCLQTDRSLDMEKVVSKLKRYYEQLNPAYRASQAFRDTLNEKRDLIMRKGKKVVYHYVQLLKEDMKAKKRIVVPVAKATEGEGAPKGENNIENANEDDEDSEEARRVRQKIKRIEKAMKECQKMIKKYEEAEIDFNDENNSHYMKLDRFKERMVELYTQMCKYTNEHPDAGRAYLRPKHLRVTQIPSVDQAINSFINSKLSGNKKNKVTKGKSFIDGLIFPDYVDILECVEKVNKEHDMKLSKRAMQNLAEKAFTQMGKHLQEARQNDYWDTFSLHLDNNVDPATSDSDLLEKLSHNKKIAEENEKKVFEEFVRRQEEGKAEDKDDSPSEGEDEDDVDDEEEGEEEEEEEEDDGKKSNRDVESDEEMSIGEDTDRESAKDDNEDSLQAIETITEAPDDEEQECTVEDDTENISKNNNLEPRESTSDKETKTSSPSPKDFAEKETIMIEVTLDDVEAEDGENEPQEEKKQPLRIRSFAKPPDYWQCSQEGSAVKNKDNTTKPKTSEDTEEEISVVSVLPGREKVVQKLIKNSKTIVSVPLNNIAKTINANPATKSNLPTVQLANGPSTSTNTTSGQNTRYITIAPGVKRPVQLPPSRVQNNIQNTKIVAVSRTPQMTAINSKQVRPVATSTPIQRTQLQIRPLQQTNQLQLVRLSNGKCISASTASGAPNTPRFITVATTSTPQTVQSLTETMRPVKIRPALTLTQVRQAQILPGQIRPQIAPWPRIGPLSRGVTATATSMQQRLNNYEQNRVKIPASLSSAQSSQVQVLRVNNGKLITSSTENSRLPQQAERNSSQQQQKVNNVTAPVKAVNIAPSTTLPVLKPRINDNVQMVQQQKTNAPRAPRPGDQNRQNSEGGPKRKNELS